MKRYNARCDNSNCDKREVHEVVAEGVEKDKLIGVICDQCHGELTRVMTPINIGRGASHARGHEPSQEGWFRRLQEPDRGTFELPGGEDRSGAALAHEINSGERRVAGVTSFATPSGNTVDLIVTDEKIGRTKFLKDRPQASKNFAFNILFIAPILKT